MKSLAFVLLALPVSVFATPAGISGFSGKGGSSVCSSCHTGGAVPTVTLTGPAALTAGMTGNYTLTIKGGAAVNSGIDVSLGGVNSGSATFTASPGTRILNGELVHSTPKAFAAAMAVYTFAVKAPLTAGLFTLSAAGLSSNNNGGPGGDEVATTSLNVTVSLTAGGPAPVGSPDAGSIPAPVLDAGMGAPAPTPSPTPAPTPTPTPAAAADGGSKSEPLPMGNSNKRHNPSPQSDGVVEGESGCSSAGGTPMLLLAALVGGALLIRSQRRTRAVARHG